MAIVGRFRPATRALLAIIALGLASGALFILYCAVTLPLSPAPEPQRAAIRYDSGGGAPFAARGVYHGEKLTADHLPPDLVQAVVAIEDRRFFSHHGIDLRGIFRAASHNFWGRGPVEGGSTTTQQLARLTYLSPERTLRRKLQEVILAWWLDARLAKNEILARYLNTVYFGAGGFGADAAAKRYFGKQATELDLAESAMLAGLIRAPSQLAPTRHPDAAHKRAAVVLQAMVGTGAIDAAGAAVAKAEPVRLAMTPESEPDDNYFVDMAEAEVKRLVGTPPLDLAVTTTVDPRLQDLAERTVKRWLGSEGARRQVGQAALVAMAPDGAVLAMVGGRDYGESQFNRVTQAKRQPGSLFKIFVYLTALSNGYTPDSTAVDQPVEIGDWQPKNYQGRYLGPVSLKTAFAQSLNSVSAQLVQAVGAERVAAMAKSLGVQSELPAVPSLALGSAEVTLLEMTRAMDAIATDTKSIEPYTVRAIRSEQSVLYSRPETAVVRPDWQPAWAPMMHLLEAVVTEGTGRAARLAESPGHRSAGKTGTTDEYRDAWFVGFTTDIVVGVWVGNDDNSPMDQVAGGDLPAKIWHDFVAEAGRVLARRPPAETPAPVALSGSTAAPSAMPPAPAGPPTPMSQTAALPPPAPPTQTPQPEALPLPSQPPLQQLRGLPTVIDSSTLLMNGVLVHLDGVKGAPGEPAHELFRYIGGREVACDPADAGAPHYRCKIGEYDLGEAVLLNGAAHAAADAPERMRQAEEQARAAHRGIWGALAG